MRFAFACAALAAVMSAPALADVVTFADGDLSGGGRIAYSPEPFQTTAIVDVGGEHGNVFQGTRGENLSGGATLGSASGGPGDPVLYATSFDIRLIDGEELRIKTSFFDTLSIANSLEWTTVTISTPFPAAISITGSFPSSGIAGGNVFQLDNVMFATGVLPDPSIPEPASWAMMISGFGLAGAALRKRAPSRPRRARSGT